MAWFRCSLGGSGGLELTVTMDSSFAGLTITCTDGDTTLTKTCPSQSPYQVEFNLPNGGTWIISGQGASTTVVVPESTELHIIPSGSTATPVNDIQTWLHCANIWNKTYSTINQVLSDTTILLALISSNNAVDYMARSTSWASSVTANSIAMTYIGNNDYCASTLLSNSTWLNAICNSTYFESVLKVKVPTMTSGTTPSGEVYSDNNYLPAWKAFDGDESTGSNAWYSTSKTAIIQYKFTQKIRVVYMFLVNRVSSDSAILTFNLQGSNDNSNWVNIQTNINNSSTPGAKTFTVINNSTKYLYYRVVPVTTRGNEIAIQELQFYGRA